MDHLSMNDRYEESRNISLQAVDQYKREVAWIEMEPLQPEEEARLFQRLERSRREPTHQHYALLAKDARDRLIEAYQPIVWSVARKLAFRCSGCMDALDLVNEGNIGFLRLLEMVEYQGQTLFFRSLVACVRGYMLGALQKCGSAVRFNTSTSDGTPAHLKRFRRARLSLLEMLGREPSYEELAAEMGVSVSKLCRVVEVYQVAQPLSLQVYSLDEDEKEYDRDVISAFETDTPCMSDHRRERVHQALETVLTVREREAVWHRYGFDGDMNGLREWKQVDTLMKMRGPCAHALDYKARKKLAVALAEVATEVA